MAPVIPEKTHRELLKCRDELKIFFCCKLCKILPDKPENLISFCGCSDVFCDKCMSRNWVSKCPICNKGSLVADFANNEMLGKAFQFMLNISHMDAEKRAQTTNEPSQQLQMNVNDEISNMPKGKAIKSWLELPATVTKKTTKSLENVNGPSVQSVSAEITIKPGDNEHVTTAKVPKAPVNLPEHRLKRKHAAPDTDKLAHDLKSKAHSLSASLDPPKTSVVDQVLPNLSRLKKPANTSITLPGTIKSKQIVMPTNPDDMLETVKVEPSSTDFVYLDTNNFNAEAENFHVSSNQEIGPQYETPKRLNKSAITPKSSNHKKKRNIQGETLLITSCRKGDIAKVTTLLENGDDVNAQDNARWTPLHEAAHHGFVDIVEKLLDHGALINLPGGPDSETPLYDAVVHNQLAVVRLLIQRGADTTIRNTLGTIPSDVAHTKEMEDVLRDKPVPKPMIVKEPVVPQVSPLAVCHKPVVILSANLTADPLKLLKKIVRKYKWKLVRDYSTDVTHIVTATKDGVCVPSFNILCGILQGKWILTEEWLQKCETDKDLALTDPLPYEVLGTTNCGKTMSMKRARLNSDNKYPGLFQGCHIFVKPPVVPLYTVGNLELSKDDVRTLIQYGAGSLITREPDPETIPQTQSTVPFHANIGSSLAYCSHYILYQTGKREPQLKYNMPHVKTLPLEWFVKSVETFQLVDP